ncbi:MAG TPA: glycosyltransferase family 39 protein [Candidatus Polarisedimenticolaceae bacterium]|nr:glycosyltransferase family 39 protein [Candidatus Polarisedimenticolaceae bacterium]
MTAPAATRRIVPTLALAVAFMAAALATRLPVRDRTLFISDAGRYALAMERYDMTAGRPHPPGNPLYIGIARAVDALVHDPPTSLAIVSAIASGFAFLFAYLLGRDVAGETAGWIAAGIVATSPLFWFFGAVAMPSTGEAALSLLMAWLVRRARAPDARGLFWLMTVALALSIGFRSTFAVLILPLWLYGAWRHPWRRIAAGLAVLAAAAAGWTLVVASLSGGLAAYREVTSSFFLDVVLRGKILGGGLGKVVPQTAAMAASALLGLGLFLVPFLAGAWGCLTGRWPFPGAAPFLAAWALPALVFHAAYDWAPRFGVLLLAPAAILAAATVAPLVQRAARRRTGAEGLPRALAALGLAVNVGLFVLPVRVFGVTLPEAYPSAARLLARNADLARRDAAVRGSLPADETLVLAYDDTFHAVWFLPEYPTVGLFGAFKSGPDTWIPSARGRVFSFEPGSSAVPVGNPIRLPDGIRRAVLYDPDYRRIWPRADLPLTELPYDAGRALAVATIAEPGCLSFSLGHLAFVRAGDGDCPPGDAASR